MIRRHRLAIGFVLAVGVWALSEAPALALPGMIHPSFQPHYGCFGYWPGPITPRPTPHYGCFGYCPGPIWPQPDPRPHWGCFGYCPGPITPTPVWYPTYSYFPVPEANNTNYYGGNIYYV